MSILLNPSYLIIDYDLTEDIRNAALRGVDVRIVTPFIPDKNWSKSLHEGLSRPLWKLGVKICEYPGFIHSK